LAVRADSRTADDTPLPGRVSIPAHLDLFLRTRPAKNRASSPERSMIDSILDAIGRTPLVTLNRLTEGLQAKVAVKVEFTNPGGSVKDRVAMAMIAEAELRGA